MRILVDGIIFARQQQGGVSRAWREYLRRLPGLGVDVRVLLSRAGSDALTPILHDRQHYQVIRDHFTWPLRIFERTSVRSALVKWHVDSSIDVFQTTYFSTLYGSPLPKVVMLYDMILEKGLTDAPQKWVDWGVAIKRVVIHNADRIVAISESTRRDLLETYPAIAPERVTVIPLASEAQRSHGLTLGDVTAKYGLDLSAGTYLLYVGARRGYKNYQMIVDYLRHRPEARQHRFLCVGGEPSGQDAAELAALGLDRNVLFAGAVGDEELSVLYRNALALTYPSRYEGFGLPVLEAMAANCPVLCSNTSSLPEVGGTAAAYFDPDSVDSFAAAVDQVVSGSREDFVNRGLQNVARYSWDRSARALVDLYRGLADKPTAS